MLASFFRWWLARISELLPDALTQAFSFRRSGIFIEGSTDFTVVARAWGKDRNITLVDAARMARRTPVTLKLPQDTLLVKRHSIPAVPRRELDQLLTHELSRVTPFAADDLFWKWDGHVSPRDRTRMDIVLTMVPKAAVAPATAALDQSGIRPDYLEGGTAHRPALLSMSNHKDRDTVVRTMAYACIWLAVAVIVLPLLLQAVALQRIENRLAALHSAVAEATSLRQALAAGGAAQGLIQQESERNGDLLRMLATVTRVLPDDTSVTDLSLRERLLAISGRTASAPRLITDLAASPAIREPAFAAPVTRIEGAILDAFQIKARLAE